MNTKEEIERLQKIRAWTGKALIGQCPYDEAAAGIAELASGKGRKAKPTRDRKERGGQDREA